MKLLTSKNISTLIISFGFLSLILSCYFNSSALGGSGFISIIFGMAMKLWETLK